MRKFICALSCATTLATASLSHPALALTATGTLDATITIARSCVVGTSAPVNFGTQGALDSDIDEEGSIEVTCTTGTKYDIALGAGGGTSVDARRMSSPAGDSIAYQLYRNNARTDVWGETAGTNTFAGTGSGSAQQIPVYGRVANQAVPDAGVYSDTVTFTVTY